MTSMSEAAAPHPKPRSKRRPFALIALAGLMLLKAFLIVTVLLGTFLGDSRILDALRMPGVGAQIRQAPASGAILAAIVAVLVLSAVGLLSGRRAGWLLAMVTTGIFVAVDIYSYVNGLANYLWMVLNIVTVFYLNQRDVRERVGDAVPIDSEVAADG